MTLHYALLQRKIKSKIPWSTCLYLEVVFDGSKEELAGIISASLEHFSSI